VDLIAKGLKAVTGAQPDEDMEIVLRPTRREPAADPPAAKTEDPVQASINRGRATLRKPTSYSLPQRRE
jgi:hypothetical protein